MERAYYGWVRMAKGLRAADPSGRRDVEKKMAGGLSFMVNGSMCCGLTNTALMVRRGPEARERALAHTRARSRPVHMLEPHAK